MITVFSGESANEIWKKAAIKLINMPSFSIESRIGNVNELIHTGLSLSDPRQRWCSSRIKAINPAFALAEVVWIMSGTNESHVINYWNPILPKYAGDGSHYHGAYGHRLRTHLGFDQLERAYECLKNNPSGRQVVLQIWDSVSDFPEKSGQPASTDIPCNICSMLKIRNNKLEWTQIVRSNDIYLGLPHNFVQFTSLQEIIAGWLGIELGTYNHFCDSLHLYEHDRHKIDISDEPAFLNTDSIALPKEKSDREFRVIYSNMTDIASHKVMQDEIVPLALASSSYNGFKNIMLIIAADAAMREGWFEEAQHLTSLCNNPALGQMWRSWEQRVQVDRPFRRLKR